MTTSTCMVTALLALLGVCASACHNFTEAERGFECEGSEVSEVTPHEQRRDGGVHVRTRRSPPSVATQRAFAQASCMNCNCATPTFSVVKARGWWPYALQAPTNTALAGSPNNDEQKCQTTTKIGFYRKGRVCREWLCS